jgi:CRISPR-associated protein Csm3
MSVVPFGHHTLQNRYCFTGMLTLDTPLRLSSGRASDETDAPLMCDRAHIPYIPGSSLRGAIRSEIERILAAVGSAAGVKGCVLFTNDDCNANARREFENQDPSEEKLASFAENELCDLCRLLGCTLYASRLAIEDAYPGSQTATYCRVRDGVGIDRDTGAAREGAKFDYEVLEKGPEFCFSMRCENVMPKDKTLINVILRVMKQGIYVGGKRAAGLGKVKLKNYTVTGFTDPKTLWEAIVRGEDPHQAIPWEEGAHA